LAVVFIILGFAVLFFMSFALVYWLAPLVGVALAFFIMALIYLALAFIVFTNRKAWIERPLVRFLADVLLN
jgi:hypothetical protein